MTRAQAQEKAEVLNGIPSRELYCPLTGQMCNPHCVCFVKHYIVAYRDEPSSDAAEKFVIKGGRCNNPMLIERGLA